MSHVGPAEMTTYVGIVGKRVGRLKVNDIYSHLVHQRLADELRALVLSLSVKLLYFKNQ